MRHFTPPANFRSAPMSDEDLFRRAPSIFAETKHESRSDRGDDLWRTFNRVQEGIIRGGQYRRNRRDANGNALRNTTARPIQNIDGDRAINRALWTLADEMQRLRQEAA